MKQSIEALVIRWLGTGVLAVVAALAAAAPAARAAQPVASLAGSARLTQVSPGSRSVASPASFHVVASFSTDPPGAQPFTIQRAEIFFPDHAGTNGRLFPSCDAARIERLHGDVARCPKGSQIGTGIVRARAIQLGLTATGRVTIFNSHGGRDLTFNISVTSPALIDRSIDAPLTQLHGRYGEKLTIVDPRSLQEIISGVFVSVERMDVTIGAAVVSHGVAYSYMRARTCPRWPMHGVFDFEDFSTGQLATATADAKVRCSAFR